MKHFHSILMVWSKGKMTSYVKDNQINQERLFGYSITTTSHRIQNTGGLQLVCYDA